jgi:peptidoglycan hydrolase CwlO-like protein
MLIEWTISLGAIIQILVVIAGGLIVLGAMRRTIQDMDKEITEIKRDQKDLTKTIAQMAVQAQRLNRLEEDVRDLRYGRGFVMERSLLPDSPP